MTILERAYKIASESNNFVFVTKPEPNQYGDISFLVRSEQPIGPEKELVFEVLIAEQDKIYVHYPESTFVIPMTLNKFESIAA